MVMTQIPDINNLRKVGFILAYSFRDISPLWWGGRALWIIGIYNMVFRQQRREIQEGTRVRFSSKAMLSMKYFLQLRSTCYFFTSQ
jgi:hypothetical protein